jgi:hypothetical protein
MISNGKKKKKNIYIYIYRLVMFNIWHLFWIFSFCLDPIVQIALKVAQGEQTPTLIISPFFIETC